MKYSDHLTAFAPYSYKDHGLQMKELVARHNVERVRSYLEKNLGCKQVEVMRALDLDQRTVANAIKIIRGRV